jgi:dTDP-4-amino-4,6-dideoxygalactose transaminase
VPCFHGSASEVYLERAFDGTGWRPAERLPMARWLGETAIAMLVHPTLTEAEIGKACDALDAVLREAAAGALSTRGAISTDRMPDSGIVAG